MRENEDALRGALTETEPTEAQFFSSWGPPGLQPAQLPIPFEGSQKRFLAKLHGKATGKNIGRSLPGCHIVWSLEDSQYVQWTLLMVFFARTQMSKALCLGMPFRLFVFAEPSPGDILQKATCMLNCLKRAGEFWSFACLPGWNLLPSHQLTRHLRVPLKGK